MQASVSERPSVLASVGACVRPCWPASHVGDGQTVSRSVRRPFWPASHVDDGQTVTGSVFPYWPASHVGAGQGVSRIVRPCWPASHAGAGQTVSRNGDGLDQIWHAAEFPALPK